MNDLHNASAMFDHLLNLNRFNNQMFFLRGFGHTFNNSINSIRLGSRLLGHYLNDVQEQIDEFDDASLANPGIHHKEECFDILTTMAQVVQGISDSTVKLDQFVSHLAELTGQIAPNSHAVDLNQLVTLCSSMIQHQVANFTNHFRLELNDSPAIVPACAGQITQVILNVMMNALFSLPDKSCGIVISTLCDYDTNRAFCFIQDEGIGISESVLPRIMEPFFTTWHEYGCAGIGLTVSDRIVRNHGGELSITSEQGKGTTVSVSLPFGKHDTREDLYVC